VICVSVANMVSLGNHFATSYISLIFPIGIVRIWCIPLSVCPLKAIQVAVPRSHSNRFVVPIPDYHTCGSLCVFTIASAYYECSSNYPNHKSPEQNVSSFFRCQIRLPCPSEYMLSHIQHRYDTADTADTKAANTYEDFSRRW
jgi:hypothetical protein